MHKRSGITTIEGKHNSPKESLDFRRILDSVSKVKLGRYWVTNARKGDTGIEIRGYEDDTQTYVAQIIGSWFRQMSYIRVHPSNKRDFCQDIVPHIFVGD